MEHTNRGLSDIAPKLYGYGSHRTRLCPWKHRKPLFVRIRRQARVLVVSVLLSCVAWNVYATELAEFDDLDSLSAEIVSQQPLDTGSADEALYHLNRLSGSYMEAVDALFEQTEFSGRSRTLSEALAQEAARRLAASDLAAAYDRFRAAARIAPDASVAERLLLRAAASAIELGENRRALEIAARVEGETDNAEVREHASVLGIRALAFGQSREDALERMQRLEPQSPLGLYQWFLLDQGSDARTSLEREHENALVTRLLDGQISRVLLPSALLSSLNNGVDGSDIGDSVGSAGRVSVNTENEMAGETASELTEQVAGLQLGSYRTEDYAYAHRDTLQEYGWSAEVVEGSDDTHKVILDFEEKRDRQYAEEQLLRLRQDGFEGFVIRSFEESFE